MAKLQPKTKRVKNPARRRILVTPSAQVWELIDEVHTLSGDAKAAIVAEMLDAVAPAFQSQIQALRMVAESPREAQRLIAAFANEKVGELMQAQLTLDAEITKVLDARTVEGKREKRKRKVRATNAPP